MKTIIKNQKLQFQFNPFGGLTPEEIEQTIIPRFDTKKLLQILLNGQSKVVELVGKKGRGKTTHLKYLHSCLEDYPILLLSASNKTVNIDALETPIIFVDSIHHLSLQKRIQIYRKVQTVVLTTHHRRWWEYRMAGKSSQSINFNGIEAALLKELLRNRIQLALRNSEEVFEVEERGVQQLIRRFGDDYRAILNYLYDEFQNLT